jgi:hypothetical protein
MTKPELKAKPTVYAGIEFRSRLEARWAAFFDRIGHRWTYEPLDGDGYIPDFLDHTLSALVEVKPASAVEEYEAAIPKMVNGLAGHWTGDLWILGVDPFPAGERYAYAGMWGTYAEPDSSPRPTGAGWHNDWFFQPIKWQAKDGVQWVRAAWAEACNVTKWQPR